MRSFADTLALAFALTLAACSGGGFSCLALCDLSRLDCLPIELGTVDGDVPVPSPLPVPGDAAPVEVGLGDGECFLWRRIVGASVAGDVCFESAAVAGVGFVDPLGPACVESSDAAGEAEAVPAGVAMAIPTPRAKANEPSRPTYLPYRVALLSNMTVPPGQCLVDNPGQRARCWLSCKEPSAWYKRRLVRSKHCAQRINEYVKHKFTPLKTHSMKTGSKTEGLQC